MAIIRCVRCDFCCEEIAPVGRSDALPEGWVTIPQDVPNIPHHKCPACNRSDYDSFIADVRKIVLD